MSEEFNNGPTFIQPNLYENFQDYLQSNLNNNDNNSYLAALSELDILDDSHVAHIQSLVIDPKAKTFDFIQSSSSDLFNNDDQQTNSLPSLQQQTDETDELADVLTNIDQTALSLQDLYVADDETNSNSYNHQSSIGKKDNSNFTNQIQSTQHNLNIISIQNQSSQINSTNSLTASYSTQNASNTTKNNSNQQLLYSPTSSIYPSLSTPTEGDIRGNAPPFTLGTPGGGYQGIQSTYNHTQTQSVDGLYPNTTTDIYGNNIQNSQSTLPLPLQGNQFIPLDMSGGVAMGLGGAHVDPMTQMQAVNGYYLATTQQGAYPEYFQMGMTPQGYMPLMTGQQDENGLYTNATTTTQDGMNYMAYPAHQQAQQQLYWNPYATQQALQQQYQQQQQHLLMMQSMYSQQNGDYSLQTAQQMVYGVPGQMNAITSQLQQQQQTQQTQQTQSGYNQTPSTTTPVFMHGNQVPTNGTLPNNPTTPMVPIIPGQQPNQLNYSTERSGNVTPGTGFMMPNGMMVPAFTPAFPMDSYATHAALMGQQLLPNGFPVIPRDPNTDQLMNSTNNNMNINNLNNNSNNSNNINHNNHQGMMSSHPSLNNLHRGGQNDRRNQISRVNSTGRMLNNNNNNNQSPNNNNLLSMNPGSRDPVVEEFRSTYGKTKQWEIKDLVGHVVSFCQDQHGSRFIQQRLEVAPPNDKQIVFDEVITNAQVLITDVFGNYVIQKLFEFGSPEQCETLASLLTGQAVNLALQMYGCRVIQKALEYVETPRLLFLVGEFEGQQVLKCVHDQNGNHVIQKCIEVMSRVAKTSPTETAEYLNSRIQYIIQSFQGRVKELSMHPYGCRVVQRILEHCTNDQKSPVLEELRVCCRDLIQDQYGNYVIQHMIQHGWETDQAVLMKEVHSKLLEYSQHKFASNVVEKCIQYADKQNRDEMIWTIINVTFDLNNPVDAKTGQCVLENMVRDPYANYVVQKVIDVSNETQRGAISRYVRENIVQLRRYTYGKHIIVRLERVSGEKF